jgi:hypothetical protein
MCADVRGVSILKLVRKFGSDICLPRLPDHGHDLFQGAHDCGGCVGHAGILTCAQFAFTASPEAEGRFPPPDSRIDPWGSAGLCGGIWRGVQRRGAFV